jgi:hypothetical protein
MIVVSYRALKVHNLSSKILASETQPRLDPTRHSRLIAIRPPLQRPDRYLLIPVATSFRTLTARKLQAHITPTANGAQSPGWRPGSCSAKPTPLASSGQNSPQDRQLVEPGYQMSKQTFNLDRWRTLAQPLPFPASRSALRQVWAVVISSVKSFVRFKCVYAVSAQGREP